MTGFDDPRLRPFGLRLLLVAVSLGWAIVELRAGSALFAGLFLALGAYLGWRLLITYNPQRGTAR